MMPLKSARRFLQKNPSVAGGIAVAVIVLSIAIIIFASRERPRRDVSLLWYYDLNTKETFPVAWGEFNEVPPVDAPSGKLQAAQGPLPAGAPAGVRALTFACADCSNEQFIGWLETHTPEVRSKITQHSIRPEELTQGWYVRRLEDEKWLLRASPEGGAIQSAVFNSRCPKGVKVKQCEVNEN